MAAMDSWLGVIVPCAGVGAIVDFYLGKTGQKRVKEQIEAWWIQLSDVNIHTFGRDEARMAHQLLLKVFGKFFSIRRYIALTIGILLAVSWIFIFKIGFGCPIVGPFEFQDFNVWIVGGVITTSISISITIWATRFLSQRLTNSSSRNTIIYISAMASTPIITLLLYCLAIFIDQTWNLYGALAGIQDNKISLYPMTVLMSFVFDFAILKNRVVLICVEQVSFQHYVASLLKAELMLFRIGIASVFLISVLFKPIQRFLLATMLKLAEFDKPAFTVIFGFIGGAAKVVKDALA